LGDTITRGDGWERHGNHPRSQSRAFTINHTGYVHSHPPLFLGLGHLILEHNLCWSFLPHRSRPTTTSPLTPRQDVLCRVLGRKESTISRYTAAIPRTTQGINAEVLEYSPRSSMCSARTRLFHALGDVVSRGRPSECTRASPCGEALDRRLYGQI
jgi:hypothetical protein